MSDLIVSVQMELTELNHLDGAVFKYDGDEVRPVAIPHKAWREFGSPTEVRVRISLLSEDTE